MGKTLPEPGSPLHATVASNGYGRLPLSFEANRGQAGPQVKFVARGQGYSLFLTEHAAVLALSRRDNAAGPMGLRSTDTDVVRMEFEGVGASATGRSGTVEGVEPLPGKVNYFVGNDPAKWHSGAPTYAKVRYNGVYPGVDLVYYGQQRQLEYDFEVAPGADATPLRLRFAGARRLQIEAGGDLTIAGLYGKIVFHKPVVYQVRDGQKEPVQSAFRLLARDEVGFSLGSYDHGRGLVIDPVLAYSTYLGGSEGDGANAIAVDAEGNAYVAGFAYSPDFPVTPGAFQTATKSALTNAFVTKINPSGTALVYSTYLGGTDGCNGSEDSAQGIAVDAEGNAYVTGTACSTDFPVTGGVFQTWNKGTKNQAWNAFVTKVNPSGSGLVYSTYVGGSGQPGYSYHGYVQPAMGDSANAIAVDSAGNACIAGVTSSNNFPVDGKAFQRTNNDLFMGTSFVTKLNASGTHAIFSTYLGGSNQDTANAVAVDAEGAVYVAGSALSTDFPVTSGAFQAAKPAGGFVTKFSSQGLLVYSSYLGGESQGYGESANAIAVDSTGDAYVSGYTFSNDFPVTSGAFQTVNHAAAAGGPNAFVTEINPSGSGLVYSTYLGGAGEQASGMALDAAGNVYLTGSSTSDDFPVTPDAFQKTIHSTQGFSNAFFEELNASGSALLYSTYLGGSGQDGESDIAVGFTGDSGSGIAVDPAGNAYLAGISSSWDFPTSPTAFQRINRAVNPYVRSPFVSKFSPVSSATSTALKLTSSKNPQIPGASLVFKAVVTAGSGSGVPAGSVAFRVDDGQIIEEPIDAAGRSELDIASLPAGTHLIGAAYAGSAGLAPSWSSITEDVSGSAADVIPFSNSPYTADFGHYGGYFLWPFQAKVTDSSGNPVPFANVTFGGTGVVFQRISAQTGFDGLVTANALIVATGPISAYATVAGATPANFSVEAEATELRLKFANLKVAYGQPLPPLSYSIDGFVLGQNASIVTGSPSVDWGGLQQGTAPGKYYISAQSGTLQAPNYLFLEGVYPVIVTITPLGDAAKPSFSPPGGTYPSAQQVTLNDATANAIIYYTTDGSMPTTSSTIYSGPIALAGNETISAIAVATGYTNSEVAVQAYHAH